MKVQPQESNRVVLSLLDMTAFSLALENRIPLKIFNLTRAGGIEIALTQPDFGTYIYA